MVFSSTIFLFAFLPLVGALYLFSPAKLKNATLLTASLFFYAWGEVFYVLIMVASIASNYCFGLLIDGFSDDSRQPVERHTQGRARPNTGKRRPFRPLALIHTALRAKRLWLCLGLLVNLGLLGTFKYANFIAEQINLLLGYLAVEAKLVLAPIHLPLGISFFTFQAISYLVDVYRNQTPAQKNIIRLALFISLFPQLIAGPIIRYKDLAGQIAKRTHNLDLVFRGVQRFIFGLAKKLLVANPLGEVADKVFALPAGELTMALSWLGVVCYSLQIYFDFSGYSDMAIGLGRMFGFRFAENFKHPYIAKSVREFWRRWHISLSTWFRDYVYIPLGGNRVSPLRLHLNLLLVFFLCGLWHGASWNFVIWGMLHGAFLIAERSWPSLLLKKAGGAAGHIYTLLVVMTAWVFFRAETLGGAWHYLKAMFSFQFDHQPMDAIYALMTNETWIALTAGLIFSAPVYETARNRIRNSVCAYNVRAVLLYYFPEGTLMAALLLLSIVKVASSTYNPFIYFRF